MLEERVPASIMPLEDKPCTTLQGRSTSCGSRGRSGKERVGEAPTRSAKLALWVNCPPSKAKSNSGWPPSQQSENPAVGEVPTQQSKFQHWVATQRAKEQEKKCGKKKARIGDPPGGRTSYNAPGEGALVASLVSSASFFDPALRETKKASVDLAGCSKVRGRQRARPARGKPRAHYAHEQGGG